MQNWKVTYHSVSAGKTLTWIATADTEQEAKKEFNRKHPQLVAIIKIEPVKM
jgi:hypothetical protein